MRHRKSNKKLGKSTSEQKKALLRSLVTALFTHGKIQTTQARAKALQPIAERLITKAKHKDLMNAIRDIKKVVYTVEASKKAIEISRAFSDRKSGFTRITPIGLRDGDAAKIVQIEFIDTKK